MTTNETTDSAARYREVAQELHSLYLAGGLFKGDVTGNVVHTPEREAYIQTLQTEQQQLAELLGQVVVNGIHDMLIQDAPNEY